MGKRNGYGKTWWTKEGGTTQETSGLGARQKDGVGWGEGRKKKERSMGGGKDSCGNLYFSLAGEGRNSRWLQMSNLEVEVFSFFWKLFATRLRSGLNFVKLLLIGTIGSLRNYFRFF